METVLDKKTKTKIAKPKQYVAVIHNDDYSSFDMVEFILQQFFGKTSEEAVSIATTVHKSGKGIAGGPFPLDVCETKCTDAMNVAKSFGMPLMLTAEES